MSDSIIQSLRSDLIQYMQSSAPTEDTFNELALRIFKYQFDNNAAYKRYCQHIAKTPRFIQSWQAIPAVPINAFKDATLSCIPANTCERVFMTSGTTRADIKGKNHHPTLDIYDLSMRLFFQQRVMKERSQIAMGILFPTPQQLPHSSLAHYLWLAKQHFGSPDSEYLINEQGLRIEQLIQRLREAEQNNRPFALLGASYSFVHLMDELQKKGLRFQLPAGSRLFDTGGFKGQSREVELRDFYQSLHSFFGVSPEHCINMYGMTELSSQLYDDGNAQLPSIKSGPHWTRARIIDPLTGADMPHGEAGIIVHYDLANLNSVSALMTEDMGVAMGTGVQLLGRAEGAGAKGCSLAMETFLQAVR